MGMEAWLTSAVGDKDALKAIVLAGSLRRVHTAKILAILVTLAVSHKLRKKLKKVFNLVIPLEQEVPHGLSAEEFAKMEGLSLWAFSKCVYLSPNTLVLKNCDEIFDKYDKFAILENDHGVDSSVYLFRPVSGGGLTLGEIVSLDDSNRGKDVGNGMDEPRGFNKCFMDWIGNSIRSWENLDGRYNFKINLKNRNQTSLSSNFDIVNLGDVHPLDVEAEVEKNGMFQEWGLIEKSLLELSRKIFLEEMTAIDNVNTTGSLQLESHNAEPIAIVGMSFRLPGGNNVDEFWDLLIKGKEAISTLPEHRWTRGQTYLSCQNRNIEAGFLSARVDEFDAKFFRVSRKEAEFMDPQQRLLHEVAWEALEDAMINPLSLRGTQTGIFVGSWTQDYHAMLSKAAADMDFFRSYMGNSIGAGPARLAHFFGTTGPSIGTESGCSSAMVAVDMACKSLRNHDSHMTMACGVNLLLQSFDQEKMDFLVAPDGRCKTFDEGANGFGRAEGCAVLVLKRLSDAVHDGDSIWGLIKGSAIVQEGISNSFGTPTVRCESLAMELALKDAQVDPADVSYVEAHGTGTIVGDPLEIAAIAKAYSIGRRDPLVIGSVKTNVGHTEAVSGITGIIKVLLSMKNEMIPPHLNLKRLNPAINLDQIPAVIPVEGMAWVKQPNKVRIAGVSSFGITGTDSHVVIQEPPAIISQQFPDEMMRPRNIMSISAKSPESLQSLLMTYQNMLSSENSPAFADLAYSANTGRATFNHRAVIIAKDCVEAENAIRTKAYKFGEVRSTGSKICFLFTGQGSQYANMATNLYSTSPIFRDAFDKCEQLLAKQYNINIRETLWGKTKDGKDLSRTLYSQTSIFTIEYSLLKLWEAWGVKPDYVMGHSLGEFAAAVAAGVLDFEDAIMLVAERSRLIDALPGGSMLAIKADKERVFKYIEKLQQTKPNFRIDYAAMNAPEQTVVAGDSEMIEEFAKFCGEDSLKTIMLAATHAFHSSHMDPMLESYRKFTQLVKRRPACKDSPKYISGMEGKLLEFEFIDADYWVRHTREPVRYMDACKVVHSEGCSLFLEIGPHPVLSAMTMMNIEGQSVICLPSIKREEDEWDTMLDSLAKLHLSDWKGEVDWKGFDGYYKRSRVTIPFYPFNRKTTWKDMETSLPSIHPLLGKVLPTLCDHFLLEKRLTLSGNSFAQDHAIGSTVVFPGSAFLEMCLAGGLATLQGSSGEQLKRPGRPIALMSLKIRAPLALYDSGTCRLQTSSQLDTDEKDEVAYSIGIQRHIPSSVGGEGEWVSHATGKFIPVPKFLETKGSTAAHIDIPAILVSWEKMGFDDYYDRLPQVGLHFGPKFRSLEMGWIGSSGLLVSVNVPEGETSYLIHPVIGDAMLQATSLWNTIDKKCNVRKMKLQIPIQIGEFVWLQSSDSLGRYIYCCTNVDGKTEAILLDGQGNHLASMKDVELIETSVKLVEGVIAQQEVAMPKIWKDVWKRSPGPLQCSYNLNTNKDIPFIPFSDSQQQILNEVNDIGEYEKSFQLNLCNLSRQFFLNALYELGWKPIQGVPFKPDELLKLLPEPLEHHRRYFTFFLQSLAKTGIMVLNSEVENTYLFRGPPPSDDEIHKSLNMVVGPEDMSRVEYQLVTRTGWNLSKLMAGIIDPLQFLFTENPSKSGIPRLYESTARWAVPALKIANDAICRYIVNNNLDKIHSEVRVIRILEIGSGTGTLSNQLLEWLDSFGKPFIYYFTDITPFFFIEAEKKFEKHLKNIVFKKFDMEEDPLAQGFCPHYFDMIVAFEAIHVAKDVRRTLRNLKVLLKPGGLFQFLETTCPNARITHIFGQLEGYWQFEDLEFRPYHISLTPENWEHALRDTNCDSVISLPVYNNNLSIILARVAAEASTSSTSHETIGNPKYSWLIFYHESNEAVAELLKGKLLEINRKVHMSRRPDSCTEVDIKELMKHELRSATAEVCDLEGIIYLWGLLDDNSHQDQIQVSLPFLSLVQEMADSSYSPRIYAVTQGTANVDGYEVTNPTSATLHGMIRAIANENPKILLNYFDLSPDDPVIKQTDEIFYNLWRTDEGRRENIAFRDGDRLCPKLCSAKVNYNEPLPLPSGCNRFQLVLPTTRVISDLEFGQLNNYALEESEVDVNIKAVGLNFKDVLIVLKPVAALEHLNSIGIEFSGCVTKVGSKVSKWKVGDNVYGINVDPNMALPSHIKMNEKLLAPLPTAFSFCEGATLAVVFATALHCLINSARLKTGETVLIHTASGGVGLCAIQLAKHVGAEIIATAGSKRKRNYLRNLGIKHVFHSRNTDFGQQILEVTNGRGVDVVLNSLTGEGFKEASLNALARNGRFIEMSKLNVWTLEEVKKRRPDSFYDIIDLPSLDKLTFQSLSDQLKEFLDSNNLQPIPYERFDAVNIRGALNYLQRAKHIGKIVCVMPELRIQNSKITSTTPLFNESGTYLVTGGLGGIGFEVVKWMLSSGAKHIAIANRSNPSPQVEGRLAAWNKSGKHVAVFAVDVGDLSQCQNLLQEIRSPSHNFPRLRGVMHAAGVLDDGIVGNQTWEKFEHTYNPKVNGSWNLHELTKDILLEHFVLFSSVASSIGTPAQCNHAASNSFEDALASYRRSIGLPATTINWGGWGEVGIATEVDLPGFRPITTSQGILALETFLRTQSSHYAVMNVHSFSLALKVFPSFKCYLEDKGLLGEVASPTIINNEGFWKEFDSTEDRQSKLVLIKGCIKSTMKNILKMNQQEDIDDLADFQSLGVDSLMMWELKNGLQSVLGSRLTLNANHLRDCNSAEILATRLVDILEDDWEKEQKFPTMEELTQLVREDSILPENIQVKGMSAVEVSEIETVLLLGSTGTLGPYLLKDLSERPNIRRIVCLIREKGTTSGMERLLKRLKMINLYDLVDLDKVECVEGDIACERLGLSVEEYNRLSQKVDIIINSAVRADHLAKYYKAPEGKRITLRAVNVKGTINIIEFATHMRLKHIFHASTILNVIGIGAHDFQVNEHDGSLIHLSEDWQDVDELDKLGQNGGYILSKHIGEQLCRQAIKRGIPCKTFRFPQLGGDGQTGRCDYVTNHFVLRWLTFLKLKCMPDFPTPMICMAVDNCSKISLDIFFNKSAPFDVYNITPTNVAMETTLIGNIGKELGITVEPVPFPEFIEKLKLENDDSPLAQFKSINEEEGAMFAQNLERNSPTLNELRFFMEANPGIFRSQKLAKLIGNYDELESTEQVMRRDIRFLKESGVFEKFDIK